MKSVRKINRHRKFIKQKTTTPHQTDVEKVIGSSHCNSNIKNKIIVARYKWLKANAVEIPEQMDKPNLFVTITDGLVQHSGFRSVFGRTLQKQSFHMEILNGPELNASVNNLPATVNLVIQRDLGMANLCNMTTEEFRNREITCPMFPPEFSTWSDDSCHMKSKQRPADSAVIEVLREADFDHWDKNLIIIARNRWLVERGLPIPSDYDNLSLCVKIVNGQLNSCFYSPDMMHIIRKQSYFIQVLN